MLKRMYAAFGVLALGLSASPVQAERTVIDQSTDGGRVTATLSGYCDFNGQNCDQSGGTTLPYSVSFDGVSFTDSVYVQGNGILTFSQPVDFSDPTVQGAIAAYNRPADDPAGTGPGPSLTDYARDLVSAGQSNLLDTGGVFLQSADVLVDASSGIITAEWFTCGNPTAPGVCPHNNVQLLTLTPVAGGFQGLFDFSGGRPETNDTGYVVNGQTVLTGNSFFLPASFQGITFSAAPEPSTWAMSVASFGMVGGALRRRRRFERLAVA